MRRGDIFSIHLLVEGADVYSELASVRCLARNACKVARRSSSGPVVRKKRSQLSKFSFFCMEMEDILFFSFLSPKARPLYLVAPTRLNHKRAGQIIQLKQDKLIRGLFRVRAGRRFSCSTTLYSLCLISFRNSQARNSFLCSASFFKEQ